MCKLPRNDLAVQAREHAELIGRQQIVAATRPPEVFFESCLCVCSNETLLRQGFHLSEKSSYPISLTSNEPLPPLVLLLSEQARACSAAAAAAWVSVAWKA